MVDSRAQELLEVIGRIKKISHKSRPHSTMPNGEFFLLASIDGYMKKKSKEGVEVPGIRVSDLSKFTHASAPATSKAIRQLEEKDLVVRIADSKDRRVVYIALTDEGKKILDNSKEKFEALVSKLVLKLGVEDTNHLIRIINNLYDILQEEFKENDKQDK